MLSGQQWLKHFSCQTSARSTRFGKRREILNKAKGPIVKTQGNGRQQELKRILEWMLKRENIDPNVPVCIKFAFEGARITVKQK